MWSRVFQIEGRCVLQDFWVILGESVRNLDSKIDSINSLSVFFSDLVPNFFCCSLLFEMMFSFESQKSVQSRVAGGGGRQAPQQETVGQQQQQWISGLPERPAGRVASGSGRRRVSPPSRVGRRTVSGGPRSAGGSLGPQRAVRARRRRSHPGVGRAASRAPMPTLARL